MKPHLMFTSTGHSGRKGTDSASFRLGSDRRNFLGRFAAIILLPSMAGLGSALSSQNVVADNRKIGNSSHRSDFDFLIGHWKISAKRLRNRLIGGATWDLVSGTTLVFPILNGSGIMDEDKFDISGDLYVGGMLRLYDAKQELWITYGLDRDSGRIQAPLSGRFDAKLGEFYGDDTEAGRTIRVRHRYINLSTTTCRWEQAFSVDSGTSWEANWIIDFKRVAEMPNQ